MSTIHQYALEFICAWHVPAFMYVCWNCRQYRLCGGYGKRLAAERLLLQRTREHAILPAISALALTPVFGAFVAQSYTTGSSLVLNLKEVMEGQTSSICENFVLSIMLDFYVGLLSSLPNSKTRPCVSSHCRPRHFEQASGSFVYLRRANGRARIPCV